LLYEYAIKKYSITQKNRSHIVFLSQLIRLGNFFTNSPLLTLIDRTIGNEYFNYDYTPLPKDYITTLSFDDVCLSVAKELWKENDRIAIFWSGGIDSTVALVALIMTNDDWQKSLVIYCSKRSIENEYPYFYNEILKKSNVEIKILDFENFYKKELFDDLYVTDGNCGDWIWACNAAKRYDKFDSSYNVIINKFPSMKKYCYNLIEKCPVKITTAFDLSWWLAFNYRWDYNKIAHGLRIDDLNYLYAVKPFFCHDLFQKWSMSNPDKKIKDKWNTYKWPAKDFIFRFTGDNYYRVNKLQKNSISHPAVKYECIIKDENGLHSVTSQDAFEMCINLQSE